MYSPGELVMFYSTVSSFQNGYKKRNPGIVLESTKPKPGSTSMSFDRGSAVVLWSDGSITSEHLGYLKRVEG